MLDVRTNGSNDISPQGTHQTLRISALKAAPAQPEPFEILRVLVVACFGLGFAAVRNPETGDLEMPHRLETMFRMIVSESRTTSCFSWLFSASRQSNACFIFASRSTLLKV